MLLQWPLRVLSNPISFRIRLLQPMHPTWWSSCSTTLVLGNWAVLVRSSTHHTLTRWPNAAFDSIAFTSPQFALRRVPHFSLVAIIMRSELAQLKRLVCTARIQRTYSENCSSAPPHLARQRLQHHVRWQVAPHTTGRLFSIGTFRTLATRHGFRALLRISWCRDQSLVT